MKIDVNKIPPEGWSFNEDLVPQSLDLETEIIKFHGPLHLKAKVSRITNAVTVDLGISAIISGACSRCLEDFEIDFKKDIRLNYSLSPKDTVIDLGPDIREEVMLDYPISPLCKDDCKGLCLKCGKNLNQGGCSCGST